MRATVAAPPSLSQRLTAGPTCRRPSPTSARSLGRSRNRRPPPHAHVLRFVGASPRTLGPSKGERDPSTPFPSLVSPRSHPLEHPENRSGDSPEEPSAPPRRPPFSSRLDSVFILGKLRLALLFLPMPSPFSIVASRAGFMSFGELPPLPAMVGAPRVLPWPR
jgi:hypothetical protein